MSEYRINRRNRISNKQKKIIRLSTSRRDKVNIDLVFIPVDGPHEDLGHHKGFSFGWPPQKPLLIEMQPTNMNVLVDTNDDKDQNYQLSTTDDER